MLTVSPGVGRFRIVTWDGLFAGSPLVYAGSELGWTVGSGMPPSILYPFGEEPAVGDVSSHLPMPWDSTGFEFSNDTKIRQAYSEYIKQLAVSETVEVSFM